MKLVYGILGYGILAHVWPHFWFDGYFEDFEGKVNRLKAVFGSLQWKDVGKYISLFCPSDSVEYFILETDWKSLKWYAI